MFNRSNFNTFDFNSYVVVITLDEVQVSPLFIGGNFKKRRKRKKVEKTFELILKLDGVKSERFEIKLELTARVYEIIKLSFVSNAIKQIEFSNTLLTKGIKEVSFSFCNEIKGIKESSFFRNVYLESEVEENLEKSFLTVGICTELEHSELPLISLKQLSESSNFFVSGIKQENINTQIKVTAKKDIESMLIYGLVDI